MAVKVHYVQGTKNAYLGLTNRLPNALYFCTDTRELFKGNDLFTDGLRTVATYQDLPTFALAADGVLYLCADSGCAYVLAPTRDSWDIVIHGVDGTSIGYDENGLMTVKAVPVEKVSGIEDKLQDIVKETIASSGVASEDTPGLVKPGPEFAVGEDGSLSLSKVEITKVEGLEERLSDIEAAQVGGVHYKGSVPTVDELPTDAAQGDLYEVAADNSEWCWNGEKWFEYGKTTDLSPVATAELDAKQFQIKDGTVHIIGVDSGLVTYRASTLRDALDSITQALTWEEMGTEVDLSTMSASDAVTAAKDGDVVILSDGTVGEALTIDRSVTLNGSAVGLPQNFSQEV